MKVEIHYDNPTAATVAKADVLVRGFAQLEGLSRFAVNVMLNETEIRGQWRVEGEDTGTSKFSGPRSILAYDYELQGWMELLFGEDVPESWVAEVIADDSGKWAGNGLRFSTKQEADRYGSDLFSRWTAVRKIRSSPSPETVNARWKDGHMERIT